MRDEVGNKRRKWRKRVACMKHTHIHTHTPRSVASENYIKQNNSHVKAQVLLLLKEVVQDVLPDEVWV